MSRIHSTRWAWIGTLLAGLICACSIFSSGSSPASSSAPQNFPLTPNPINVTINLDTQLAVSNQGRAIAGVANGDELSGKTANGTTFNFGISGYFLTQEADGTLDPAYGTPVTVTPVSAIGGIPFSKGFVTAFQLDPEGLLMVDPATFEMNIPGNYSDLVGFASNGDGTDFHLYPVLASAGGGSTIVTFDVMHFSVYGVAEATQAEVMAQESHPPASTYGQDDDLLAAPDTSDITRQLLDEHNRLVQKEITVLDNLQGTCKDVTKAARDFTIWYNHVQNDGKTGSLSSTINGDTSILLVRLKDCLKLTCPLCLTGKTGNQKSVMQLQVQSGYVALIDTFLGNTAEANLWRGIADKCSANSGLPQPEPHVAECQGGSCGPTAPALSCP